MQDFCMHMQNVIPPFERKTPRALPIEEGALTVQGMETTFFGFLINEEARKVFG